MYLPCLAMAFMFGTANFSITSAGIPSAITNTTFLVRGCAIDVVNDRHIEMQVSQVSLLSIIIIFSRKDAKESHAKKYRTKAGRKL